METPTLEHKLDAIFSLTANPAWLTDYVLGDHTVFGTSPPGAVSGWPAISVPFGYVRGSRLASRSSAPAGASPGCSPSPTPSSRRPRRAAPRLLPDAAPAAPPPGGSGASAARRSQQRHDNLAFMDSWRGLRSPDLPGRGPEPRLRDTATGELTVAATGRDASLYACGITPYDATHLGHAATFTAWDLLVRAWLDAGTTSLTRRTSPTSTTPSSSAPSATAIDWRELALREIERYRRDMEALRDSAPGAPDRRGGGGAPHRPGSPSASPPALAVRPRGRHLLRPLRRPGVRGAVRPGQRPWPVAGADDGAVRGARRRPGPAGQEGPARRPRLARGTPGASPPGSPASALGGPAGTWSARRSPWSSSARPSTCRWAAATWSSRTTR